MTNKALFLLSCFCVLSFTAHAFINEISNNCIKQSGSSYIEPICSVNHLVEIFETKNTETDRSDTRRSFISNFLIGLAVGTLSTSRVGAEEGPPTDLPFVGFYSDPYHPGFYREILSSENRLKVTGTDDGKKIWELPAVSTGGNVEIDFSPKGGPKKLLGKWDGSGIIFADGNRWTKVTPDLFVGGYSDPQHPGMPREISVRGKDKRIIIKGYDDIPNYWRHYYFDLVGTVTGISIIVDFTPKGGPAQLKGYWDGSGIMFEDGNKWTKIRDTPEKITKR